MSHDTTYPNMREVFDAVSREVASGASAGWFYSGTLSDFGIIDSRGNRYRVPFLHLKAESEACPPGSVYGRLIRTMAGRDKVLQAVVQNALLGSLMSCHA